MSEKDKKVLVVGSGGRCHALVDSLSKSARVGKIYCAPGNAGIAELAECVDIKADDIASLADFAQREGISLTVVGPEAPLCDGIADEFAARSLPVFGPKKAAAMIEGSKEFAKEIMQAAKVPTGAFRAFSDYEEAAKYVDSQPLPIVIKFDGLAAGKGVVIADTREKALETLREMLLDKTFGEGRVIIEEFLQGPEFSFMCFVNGDRVYPLEVAQDHKRAFDGDTGPNTGGMGAYSPVPFISDDIRDRALREIMQPVASELERRGTPFTGILYGGLMLTKDGPKVIEFNARFGDPETEVVLPRLESDIYDFIEAVMRKEEFQPRWNDDACLGIVLAAKGYPGAYPKGLPLRNLEAEDCLIYHMGTKAAGGETVSNGGRVLMSVGLAPTLEEARNKALAGIENIADDNYFYRKDIGKQAGLILDGKTLARKIKSRLAAKVKALVAEGNRAPGMAIILIGDDPASVSYVTNKIKDAEHIGFKGHLIRLPENVAREEVLDRIHRLNADAEIDGILVQLPIPEHINENELISAISPDKDVDGFHPENVAALWLGKEGTVPCTPRGIISILRANGIGIAGKKVVVVGRGRMVGMPLAKMLLDNNATVTVAHRGTENLAEITREADILVVAAGHHSLIKGDMIKDGAVVVDVGINRNEATGELEGDVVFTECQPKAAAITPVPGGVGPLTRASLLENTFDAYLKHIKK